MRKLCQQWTFFARDARGTMALPFGLLAVMLVAMMGAAIDFGRWHNAHSKTEAALDAALLAAGRQLQTEPNDFQKALDTASAYFSHLTGTRLTVDNAAAEFQMADENMSIEGKATGKIKTPFLSLATVSELDVSATSKAELAIGGNGGESDLEISIMLDVTESMCDGGIGPCTAGTKITAMKDSAKDLINIVLGANATVPMARVALVPFSTRVLVGDPAITATLDLMKDVTNLDATWQGWYDDCTSSTSSSSSSEAGGTWTCNQYQAIEVDWKLMPCVTDRTGPDEFLDTKPGADAWLNAHDGGRSPKSWDHSDTPLTSETGNSAADPSRTWNYSSDGECSDAKPANYVVPLTANQTLLETRIDALDAYGATAGALGTAWAWYVISPEWDSIWQNDSKPASYADLAATNPSGAPKLRKIAVLMTDGVYNTYRGWKDHDPVVVANNAKQICANMKAKGIEIFTIGFDLDSLPAAQKARAIDTLQTCGTDIDHFYNSIDPVQLKNAFRDIAMRLTTLFIAK